MLWFVLGAALTGGTADTSDVAVVQIETGDGTSCTGTVIAPRAVLTAAHCATPPLTVLFDALALDGTAIVHPAFDPATLASDLAIVTLSSDAPVAPLALASHPLAAGDPITLVGFGRDSAGISGSRRQLATTVATLVGARFTVTGAANACAGDSGGPSLDAGTVVGVVSSGDAMCGMSSEHVRVYTYAPWVHAQLGTPVADAAPSVAVTRPGPGATMPDELTLGLAFSDDYGVIAASASIDGGAAFTIDVASAVPLEVAPGDHVMTITARDANGQMATTELPLTIEPPIHAPRSPGAACWDDTDCDASACDDHICRVPSTGGCAATPEPSWLAVVVLGLLLRRRRIYDTLCARWRMLSRTHSRKRSLSG